MRLGGAIVSESEEDMSYSKEKMMDEMENMEIEEGENLFYDEYDARSEQVGGEHYKAMPVQPWDVIDSWPLDQQVGFHRGNALKYIMRAGSKDDPLQEIRKAAHYLCKLEEILENASK